MIFKDETLTEISEQLPDSRHTMLEIKGVDRKKYEEYGHYFMEAVRRFNMKHRLKTYQKSYPA
jgi:superfamily II DNA helicase RecQ